MRSNQFAFEAIGTAWSIDIFDKISTPAKNALLPKIRTLISDFDNVYSRFKKDSLVFRISKKSGEYAFPKNADPLFDLYYKLYEITEGAFTPLIGNVMEDAGYDATYSLKPKKLHKPLAWQDAISYEDQKLIVKQPVLLDFGAVGKGYFVDLVCNLLNDVGFKSFCVDAGGDIYYKSSVGKQISIGLEHPDNTKRVIGVAQILNQSICASAGNRRKWDTFHNIINPHTLTSPKETLSVWVISDTAIAADALATCLFFVDPKKLQEFSFEYLILNADYSVMMSQAFPAEIYYNKSR